MKHTADSNFLNYERPSLATDLVLFRIANNKDKRYLNKSLQVQLIKRDIEPFANKWSLSGAFVNIDETIENAIKSKVFKKSGYNDVYLEQLFTFDKIDRDPRWRVIGVSYIGILNSNENNVSNTQSEWFSITDEGLVSENGTIIAFDNFDSELAFDHGTILKLAIERLRNKIFYTDIAFNFISENFTIRELQDTFEAILNKKINNFHRTMKDKIVETGDIMQGQAYRPAKYYKKNF